MKDNEAQLRTLLNKIYGFPDAKAATVKKIKQYFDEGKSQHVIFIEFRISRGEKTVAHDSDFKKNQRLLYQLLNMKNNA